MQDSGVKNDCISARSYLHRLVGGYPYLLRNKITGHFSRAGCEAISNGYFVNDGGMMVRMPPLILDN